METLSEIALVALTLAAPPGQDGDELQGGRRGQHAPAPVAGTVLSKDGTRIAFERAGQGPLVLLVSGALSDRADTARLGALLARDFSVIQYDRRGRGKSGNTLPYAVQREIEDLEALIDEARKGAAPEGPEGGPVALFGSSSGAVLALETAAKLPTKVARQVLFEPPFVVDDSRPRVPEDFPSRVGELVASGRRGDAVAYFMTDAVGVPPDFIGQMRTLPMWPKMEALAHTLAYDVAVMGETQAGQPLPAKRWATATAETLVLDGGASPPWLHAAADALADVLPQAERRTLEGLDHSAAQMAPEALVPVLVEFLGN